MFLDSFSHFVSNFQKDWMKKKCKICSNPPKELQNSSLIISSRPWSVKFPFPTTRTLIICKCTISFSFSQA